MAVRRAHCQRLRAGQAFVQLLSAVPGERVVGVGVTMDKLGTWRSQA